MIDPSTTVAGAVLDHSECASVFHRHRIDFCCRGDLSVREACQRAGLDEGALMSELEAAIACRNAEAGSDPRLLSTRALIDHIVLLTEGPSDPARIARELSAMHDDHLVVGVLLARLRDATGDYRLPDWACASYRTLYSELADLERDVLAHVHLENHVLMPRFAAS